MTTMRQPIIIIINRRGCLLAGLMKSTTVMKSNKKKRTTTKNCPDVFVLIANGIILKIYQIIINAGTVRHP